MNPTATYMNIRKFVLVIEIIVCSGHFRHVMQSDDEERDRSDSDDQLNHEFYLLGAIIGDNTKQNKTKQVQQCEWNQEVQQCRRR